MSTKETDSSINEHKQEISFWGRRTAVLEDARLHPPQRTGDMFACGRGSMRQNDEGGHEQDPSAVGLVRGTLRELHAYIKKSSRIGPKFNQVCMYAAAPLEPGSAKKTNHAFSQVVFLDLDGLCTSPEDVERLRAWKSANDRILASSSSHNPVAGKYCFRLIFPINASLTYEEHAGVAAILNQQLAEHMGRSEGIDPANKRSMQPMLLPAWKDEDIALQAVLELHEPGSILDVSFIVDVVRKEIAEEKSKERARQTAVNYLRPVVTHGLVVTHDDHVDALDGARADLHAFSVPAGQGRSNKDLYRACCIARDWGLDLDEAVTLLESIYVPQGQPAAWIQAKARSAWSSQDPSRGWRMRASRARREFVPEEIFSFADSVTHEPVTHDVIINKRVTPCVTTEPETPAPAAPRSRGTRMCDRYLPPLEDFNDLEASVTYIKSACGTGKNVRLKLAWEKLQADGGRGIGVCHRVSLSRDQSGAWGVACYQDLKGEIEVSASVCLDSLERVSVWDSGPDLELIERRLDVLVIDESEQVGRHLFSDTIRSKGKIGAIYSRLKALVRAAKRVICQDADLGPFTIFLMRLLKGWTDAGQHDELFILNTWQPGNLSASIHASEEAYWSEFEAAVAEGPVWEYCTSRETCEAHAKKLRKQNPKKMIVAMHSGTTGSPEVQALLNPPPGADPWLSVDVVIATASVGTGVSVDTLDRFRVFGHARSGAGPLAQDVKQGLSRVRHPRGGSWTIFTGGRVSWNEINSEAILADLQIKCDKTVGLLKGITWEAKYEVESGLTHLQVDNFDLLRLQAEALALSAKHGNHLHSITVEDLNGRRTTKKGALELHLEACGISVTHVADDLDPSEKKIIKEELKAARMAVTDEFADRVVAAPTITLDEAAELAGRDATPELEAQVTRAFIEDFYGMISKDVVLKDDRGRRRGKIKNLGQVLAWQRGEKQAVQRLDFQEMKAGIASHCRHHSQQAALQATLWRIFGINDLDADAKARTKLKAPTNILTAKLKEEVKRTLGITLGKTHQKNIMVLARSLAQRAGVKLSGVQVRDTATGARSRVYSLDAVSVAEAVSDGVRYFERITDPNKTPPHLAMKVIDGDVFLAALMDEDQLPLSAAA